MFEKPESKTHWWSSYSCKQFSAIENDIFLNLMRVDFAFGYLWFRFLLNMNEADPLILISSIKASLKLL